MGLTSVTFVYQLGRFWEQVTNTLFKRDKPELLIL